MILTEVWDKDWLAQLSQTYLLDQELLRRLGDEYLSYLSSTVQEFVLMEHRRAQAKGLNNDEIWPHLQERIQSRRFRVPAPSVRQLRRMIYG